LSINIDPGYIVVRVLSKVYAYLQEDSRVIRPGSVRSFESAVNDIMMRIMLEGGVDYDKFKETVVRVGIENLYLSVETTNPEDKKRVLEEAFERAFEDLETRQSEVGPESLDQQVSGFNVGASDNFENTEKGNNDETEEHKW